MRQALQGTTHLSAFTAIEELLEELVEEERQFEQTEGALEGGTARRESQRGADQEVRREGVE